jgi:hypothetical protein
MTVIVTTQAAHCHKGSGLYYFGSLFFSFVSSSLLIDDDVHPWLLQMHSHQ